MNDDSIMKNLSGCSRMLCFLVLSANLVFLPSSIEGSPKLLFSNRKDILLLNSADPDEDTTVLVPDLSQASAIDFLYKTDSSGNDVSTYCWSDHFDVEGIYCVTSPHFDTPKAIVTTGVESPDGLAIDWVTEKLYWVDSVVQSVEVCELRDGSSRKVLYYDAVDRPRALALDPRNGYMYWTDWGQDPKIERAGMNGDLATRSSIVAEELSWPNGLTIDFVENRLYWIDASLNYIHMAKLDGTNRTEVRTGALSHPFAITVYDDTLYWTDWRNRSIFSCKKEDCSTMSKVKGNLFAPMDIDVFEPDRQGKIVNPCEVNNGGCSHLCLLAPQGRYNCACPTGTLLNADNLTCADVQDMIFLATRGDLRMISLDTPDFTDLIIEVGEVSHAIAIDYDPVDRLVYWTDDEERVIKRALLNGSDVEIIVSVEVLNPDGLAIDWVSRNMFWTDTGTDRIEVARLDGSSRRIIISDDLDEPRAIAVDPMNGLIYWTDWGIPAKIETAAMDGSMRKVLIDSDLFWPNGIALDFEYKKLYWAEAKLDKIEESNWDGSERKVIVDSQLPHVFGFDLAGKYIYWTDWQRRTIERVNKLQPVGTRQIIVDQLPDLMTIRAIAMKPNDSYTNGCVGDNGGCSNLCLNTPNGYVCTCPMGMELYSDNSTCIVPKAFLLFSQPKTIKRASIQYTHNDVSLPIQHLSNVTALDVHIENKLIYFSDNINGSIRNSFLNGSAVKMVLEFSKESPTAMALDWLSANIYFIDDSRKLIEVFNLQGNVRKVIVWDKLGDPRSIALYPGKGFIYWTDWNDDGLPVIGRAKLDGSDQMSLLSGLGRCGSISIDMDTDRIFWINYDRLSIQSAGLNGENVVTIKDKLTQPFSLNIYDSSVYWYDIQERAIRRVNKVNGSDDVIIQTGISSMNNLVVHHKSRQKGWTKCKTNNGGCESFCFSTGDGSVSKCDCPTHYILNRDGKTCTAPKNFLLLSERVTTSSRDMHIKRLLDSSSPQLVLPMRTMRSVKTLEYDSLYNYIYWVIDSGKGKAIRRSAIDGSNLELFLHDNRFSPGSMVIDPYSRVMFWVDSQSGTINATTLGKVAIGLVYLDDTKKAQTLAISPERGYLFFTTQTDPYLNKNEVLRMYLDGSQRTTIITGGTIAALAVDQERDWLYYSDKKTGGMFSSDFDGQNERTLLQGLQATSLTVYNDKLYYVQDRNLLYYVDKITGKNRKQVQRYATDISDVHAVNGEMISNRERNLCATNNGDCSHICYINSQNMKSCGCPVGFKLNMNQLSCEPTPTCKPSDFVCSTGKGEVACIPSIWRCDGLKECADGADEEDCPQHCSTNEYKCGSGECIDKSKVCDGIGNCADSSDEKKSCCTADQFMCIKSFECIARSKVGDGIRDCDDDSDESRRITTSPPGNPYAVGIIVVLCIVSVFILFIIIFVVWKCHKRSTSLQYTDPSMLTRQVVSVDSLGTAMMDMPPNHGAQSVTATTVISASSGTSGGVYDRNHVTGASSSSSSMTHLQAGFNPPPSPVTERSAFIGHNSMMDVDDCSTLVSSAYPTYHTHGRRLNINVPPTTPISTCDDSEPSMVNYSTQRPRLKRKSTKKYHLLKQYGTTEPLPPPPTPSRSQICSADEASECPPSPSTVRSFRSTTNNPYPPPPSPEPTSDNS